MNLIDLEMQWLREFLNWVRSPWINWIFIGLNWVDTLGFVLIAISIVWYLMDRKVGIKMFYIFVLSGVLNKLIKHYFDLPRPCQLDPSLGLVCFKSPGFPSGAAQSAMLYLGIILIECKKKVYWLLGGIFAFLLCFSRIYLGVHFFTDILGGIVIGGGLVFLYWKVFPKLEKYWKPFLFIFPFIILLLYPKVTLPFFWVSLTVGIGLLFYDQKGIPKWKQKIIQTLSVLIGVVGSLIGIAFLPTYSLLLAVLCGFWLSYIGPSLGNWFFGHGKQGKFR